MFLWRPSESSAPAARLHGHAAPVSHLAFSPDGAMLATASFDKSARVWDGVSGAFRAKLLGHVDAALEQMRQLGLVLVRGGSSLENDPVLWGSEQGQSTMEPEGILRSIGRLRLFLA